VETITSLPPSAPICLADQANVGFVSLNSGDKPSIWLVYQANAEGGRACPPCGRRVGRGAGR